MFRPWNLNRLSTSIFATGVVSILSFSAGCGGSNSSPVKPSNRAVVINAVQASRLSADVFRIPDFTGNEELSRNVVSRVRQGVGKTRSEDANEGYDEEQNLYYRYMTTPDGFKIVYHTDAARTDLAGYIEFRQQSETAIHLIFRVAEGNDPFIGDINLVLDAPEASTGRLYGDVRDPRTGERIVFDFRVNDARVIQGAFTARSPGMVISFEDIVIQEDGNVSADIRYGALTGALEQKPDTSGRLTLTDTTGTYIAEYDADGKGGIKLPTGQVIPIDDFDLDDTEK